MVFNVYSPIEQVRNLETTYREVSDIYDISTGVKGLSNNCIQKLPMHKFHSRKMIESCDDFCCSICLQVNINILYLSLIRQQNVQEQKKDSEKRL